MIIRKVNVLNRAIILSLLLSSAIAKADTVPINNIWQKLSCGAMTDVGNGIVELAGTDYRAGNTIVSRILYDFTKGSETLISFMPIDSNYSGFGTSIDNVLGIGGTTNHSWAGSTLLSSGTWYYTRLTIKTDRTYTATLSRGDYDIVGGTLINSLTGTLSDVQWANAKVGRISIGLGDNYSGTSAKVQIRQTSTTAVPLPVLSGTEVVYDFNDGQIPPDFRVLSGNWSVDNKTLKLSTTGNQTSPVELPLNRKAVQVSFSVKTDILRRSWGWDSNFGFTWKKDATDIGGYGWVTTPPNSCWLNVTVPLSEETNTLRWTYTESNYYSGSPSSQNHQVAIDDVRVLYKDYPLTINKAGTGSGTVTSNLLGINCGIDCTENYASGTSVTLTATPIGYSTFMGWSEGTCSGNTCTVNITAVRNVTATFIPTTYTLMVTKVGAGSGRVTSNPVGINCGTDCDENYNPETPIILTAVAETGSTFTSWGGVGLSCVGTGTCSVSMTAAKGVIANFSKKISQIIIFGTIPVISVGDTGTVLATGGASGNLLTFVSTTPSVCTVSNSTVRGVTAGLCSITASQAGNTNYLDSLPTTQTFSIGKAHQTISATTFTPTTLVIGGTIMASATTTSGLMVTFSSTTPSFCTISGSTVTGIKVGACVIAADQVGNSNYFPARQVIGSIDVSRNQTINFETLLDKTYGNTPFIVKANSSSTLPVSFISLTTRVCTVTPTMNMTGVTLVGDGVCTVRAIQMGNGNYNPASAVERSFTVVPVQAVVALANLNQTYNGRKKFATCSAHVSGAGQIMLATRITYSDLGSGIDRVNAGSYGVQCVVNRAGYNGNGSGTLVIRDVNQGAP